MINELIEQIGGRDRLENISSGSAFYCIQDDEGQLMARALLAVLDAQSKPALVLRPFGYDGETFRKSDIDHHAAVVYYTAPPASSVPEGWLLIPAIPSQSHLNSIAMRYQHDFYLLPDNQRDIALSTARQMYEECSGQGFYSIPKPAAPAPGGEK